MCGCGCGRPADESRKKIPYIIREARCYAGRALDQHRRTEREKHKDAPEGWDDGIHYYAEPADEAEVAAKTNTRRRGGMNRAD
jgi:hypothetical protein